ncbi:MAG TPA: GatB/YqeY domain-containing protein [Firmicutes bacterium]|nr:GatB/YqeY domain-containing protein [Bacillota bacterium]
MSLKDRLLQDMKTAMKEKEAGKTRLAVIRMARSAIKNREIELGRELSDPEVLEVLAREVKMRRDALPDYERSGREELVAKLKEEIAVLLAYLPEQLSEGEIEALAREVIAQINASGPKDLGRVMKEVMPRIRGRAEGKVVNTIVRRLLEELQA